MIELFPSPIRCSNPSCTRDDLREVGALIQVGLPPLTVPVTLGDFDRNSPALLRCPYCQQKVALGDIPGVFFHPGRNRWIVWTSRQTALRRHSRPDEGVLRDDTWALGLQFDPRHLELVDAAYACHREVVQFTAVSGQTNTPRWPELPVRADYIDLVDPAGLGAFPVQNGDQLMYRIPFYGHGDPYLWPVRMEHALTVEDAYIEVWPKLPGWRTYWLRSQFLTEGEIDFTDSFDVQAFVRNPTSGLLQRAAKPNGLRPAERGSGSRLFSEWPEIVHYSIKGTIGGALVLPSPGVLPVRDPQRGAPEPRRGCITIDFGTARSLALVAQEGDGPQTFGGRAEQLLMENAAGGKFRQASPIGAFPRTGLIILDGAAVDRDALPRPTTSFGASAASDGGPRALILRSVVTFAKDEGPRDASHPAGDDVPFHDYTCRPTQGDPSRLTDFPARKWPIGDYAGSVERFLRGLLLCAAAEAQRQFPGTDSPFTCSLPLAFSQQDKRDLAAIMERAVEWVNERLPAACKLKPRRDSDDQLQMYPESLAASMAAAVAIHHNGREYAAVADMGGGTLDLSLWRSHAPGEFQFLVSDSVGSGAEHVLEGLLKACSIADESNLRWDIFNYGYGQARDKHRGKQGWADLFEPFLEDWIGIQVEYMARSFGASLEGEEVDELVVLLAGGGWKVVEAWGHKPADLRRDIRDRLCSRFTALGVGHLNAVIRVKTDLLESGLEKLAVAGGLQRLVKTTDDLPFGVRGPNGVDERAGRDVVSWKRRIHDGGWPGRGILVTDDGNVVPPLPGRRKTIRETAERLDGILRTNVENRTGRRLRTALSLLTEYLLKHEIVPRGK